MSDRFEDMRSKTALYKYRSFPVFVIMATVGNEANLCQHDVFTERRTENGTEILRICTPLLQTRRYSITA